MPGISFDRYVLRNGLRVLVHEDRSTPMVCLNVMYDVGSRDERPERTGFAHLFEHLMFGGSVNVPDFDSPLQRASGTNNAFTSSDVTNYYEVMPAHNIETAFWLESDRMLNLAFTPKSLEVQRNVVIEEFRQRYLNQPYGDAWLLMRPLAYQRHPYRWATIGKEERHIAEATMDEVRAFYDRHYRPKNAVLALAGNISSGRGLELADKWFGPIEKGDAPKRVLPIEPPITEARRQEAVRDIPMDAIYVSFHCPGRQEPGYPAFDLLADVLAKGNSSRLYLRLVKERGIFTGMSAFVTGERDTGLFTIAGHIAHGRSVEEAEQAIWEEIRAIQQEGISREELEKVKNQWESQQEFTYMNVLNRAMNLAYYELLGDAGLINSDAGRFMALEEKDIIETASSLTPESSCTLVYRRKAQ